MGIATTHSLALALRRIDKLEASRRRVARSLGRCIPGSPLAEELTRQKGELDVQLRHWREAVAQAEAQGLKIWTRQDFVRGDFILYRGTWYEVLRVNVKSVTVPHPHAPGRDGCRDVMRRDDRTPDWTWTIGYHDGISARKSAEEMDRSFEDQGPKDHEE